MAVPCRFRSGCGLGSSGCGKAKHVRSLCRLPQRVHDRRALLSYVRFATTHVSASGHKRRRPCRHLGSENGVGTALGGFGLRILARDFLSRLAALFALPRDQALGRPADCGPDRIHDWAWLYCRRHRSQSFLQSLEPGGIPGDSDVADRMASGRDGLICGRDSPEETLELRWRLMSRCGRAFPSPRDRKARMALP